MTKPDTNPLSLEEKIGQFFFIGIPGDTVEPATALLLDEIKPGGVCLFARNIKDATQTRDLLDQVRGKLPIEPFLSIDQEGGLVDRLRRVLTPMPAAAKIADASRAAEQAEIISESLRMLGFNMDFAPVVDVVDGERARFTNGLHSRAYGSSTQDVVAIAGEFLATLQKNGIIGCLKHFPGLGASEVDSHEELPVVPVGQDEFDAVDLYPYRRLIADGGVKAVMVAHAAYPNLGLQENDQNGKLLPSSLSSNVVTKLLRQDIGFDGLVLTDDLEMGAIVKSYGIGEASVMAILAGHDMVCICAGVDAIRESHRVVTEAVESGRIGIDRIDESVARILKLKSELLKPAELELGRISALTDRVARLNENLV